MSCLHVKKLEASDDNKCCFEICGKTQSDSNELGTSMSHPCILVWYRIDMVFLWVSIGRKDEADAIIHWQYNSTMHNGLIYHFISSNVHPNQQTSMLYSSQIVLHADDTLVVFRPISLYFISEGCIFCSQSLYLICMCDQFLLAIINFLSLVKYFLITLFVQSVATFLDFLDVCLLTGKSRKFL